MSRKPTNPPVSSTSASSITPSPAPPRRTGPSPSPTNLTHRALAAAWLAVIAFLATDIALRLNTPDQKSKDRSANRDAIETHRVQATSPPATPRWSAAPALIIEARFNGPVPADAMLIVSEDRWQNP
jgi:hypothetical protein